MVKRSIEQDLRTRNFETRKEKIESNMLVKNQREQRHVLKGQGDCWQWKAMGQCSKGNNCIFWHDTNKRAKPATQPALSPEHPKSQDAKDSAKAKSPGGRSPFGRINRMPCKDHLKCTERIPLVKSGILQSVRGTNLRKAAHSVTSARLHTAGLRNKLAKKVRQKCTGSIERDKEFGLRISGRGSAKIIIDFTEELNHDETNSMCQIFFSSAAQRQTSRPKTVRSIKICHGDSPQRSPNAPKFEDRSQEETTGLAKQRGGWQRKS